MSKRLPQAQLESCLEDSGYPVVNSPYMNFYRCGMDIGGNNTRSAFNRPAWRIRAMRKIGLFSLIVPLVAAVYCQSVIPGAPQSPNTPDCTDPLLAGSSQCSAQNPSTPDCTDPLLASSSQCSGQNQQDVNSVLRSQARPIASPPNGNYSDIEQLSRQSAGRNQAQQQFFPPEPPVELAHNISALRARPRAGRH